MSMSEAEAMGAYEADFDDYEEGLEIDVWIQRDGTPIAVSRMSVSHLENTLRLVERKARNATWENDICKWEAWVDRFESELYDRKNSKQTQVKPDIKTNKTCPPKKKKACKTISQIIKSTSSTKLTMICHCGTEYIAKVADLKRGWALCCSKRCASIRREYGSQLPTLKEIK